MKNRWNSTLKRQTQVDSDGDTTIPATKRAKTPSGDWPEPLRLPRAHSDPSALFMGGIVRAAPVHAKP